MLSALPHLARVARVTVRGTWMVEDARAKSQTLDVVSRSAAATRQGA
jgi:hypothetical protein